MRTLILLVCFAFTAISLDAVWRQCDAATEGTIKWSIKAGESITTSPVIADDGTIYVGTRNYLYAVTPDGTIKGGYAIGSLTTPAIGVGGIVYVGSGYEYLHAINPNGTLKWKYKPEGSGKFTSPAIANDGTIIVGVGSEIHAVNPDGTNKWVFNTWQYGTWSKGTSTPVIGADGTIYVGIGAIKGYHFVAINPNGTFKWAALPDSGTVLSSPAIGADGTIYVPRRNGFVALNPDGTTRWSFEDAAAGSSSPVIGTDGTIYAVITVLVPAGGSLLNEEYKLYAINPDGTKKWSSGNIPGIPVIGANGTIYIGYYAFNPDGTVRRLDKGVGSASAIDTDGTIYTVGADSLSAITSSSGGLANSPWPMFQHDARHTGNVTTALVVSPTPDIKANVSSDDSINLGIGDNLSVSISLTAGSSLGVNCDWWVVVDTPFGWFYFDVSTMLWAYAGGSYTNISPTYQGPLFDLSTFEVLNMPGLPAGTYTFYFAVDTNRNGVLDFVELFSDSVVVNINS